MAQALQIVVCAGIVPDPLQTLEPVTCPNGPGLKNEMVLPAVLDPWAACALYEAAQLVAKNPGSKLWLVSLGPKAKLQQVMMTVGQKAAFELVPIDGPIGGFPDAHSTAAALAEAIAALPGLDRNRLLLFGGWESATRGAGVTLQLVGERLGIGDQFQGVDQITLREDGSFEVLERVEGGRHQVSVCAGAPAVLGWATGNLAEPRTIPRPAWRICAASCPRCRRPSALNWRPTACATSRWVCPNSSARRVWRRTCQPMRSPANLSHGSERSEHNGDDSGTDARR